MNGLLKGIFDIVLQCPAEGLHDSVARCIASEKGDRHRRQTEYSRKTRSATEPVPIFGLPAYSLSIIDVCIANDRVIPAGA